MIEVEIVGNDAAITAIKENISPLASAPLKSFHHKGASGEAGIYGLLTAVLPAAVPKLLDLLKRFVGYDRDLKISFNGVEIAVKDVKEATEIIDLLKSRAVILK